jgi:hypothetical protein
MTSPVAEEQPAPSVLEIRRRRLAELFDLTQGRGLEIGPLASPIATREVADVRYVDVMSRAALVAHYGPDPNVDCDAIPELDYWLQLDDGSFQSLAEAVAAGAPFDWALASHVVEHVPDLIGWLAQLAEILVDGGTVVLFVPDRRFCFDARRTASTVGQILQAHDDGDLTPSVRAVFDHFRAAVHVEAARAWLGEIPGRDQRIHTFTQVVENVDRARRGQYVDSHVWTFTPGEFVELLDDLGRLGVLDFAVRDVVPTVRNELEFTILLTRIARGTRADVAAQQREEGTRRAEAAIATGALPDPYEVLHAQHAQHARAVDELAQALRDSERARAEIARLTRQVRRVRRRRDELRAQRDEARETARRARRRLRAVRRQRDRVRARLTAITGSVRWRVGGALTRPAARVRRALRRGTGLL